jgi:hypothetical protein
MGHHHPHAASLPSAPVRQPAGPRTPMHAWPYEG